MSTLGCENVGMRTNCRVTFLVEKDARVGHEFFRSDRHDDLMVWMG